MKLAYLAHIAKCVEGDVVEHFMDKSEDSNSEKTNVVEMGLKQTLGLFVCPLIFYFAFSGAKRQGMS